MKKELTYLSLPDYFNKFLLSNFNQKIDLKDNMLLQFRLNSNYHLGAALKAIYLLEIIFPKKPKVLKIILKQKKVYFGQKTKNKFFFNFDTTLSSIEFFDFFRFFTSKPFNKNKSSDLFVTNRKLKQFDFNKALFIMPKNLKSSFLFIKLYHLN